MPTEIEELQSALAKFAQDRDWDQFHSPKNLASALIVECGELLEIFQWMKEHESRNLSEEARKSVTEELADVFLYTLRLADVLCVDLVDSSRSKLALNAEKYPLALSKGRSEKSATLFRESDA